MAATDAQQGLRDQFNKLLMADKLYSNFASSDFSLYARTLSYMVKRALEASTEEEPKRLSVGTFHMWKRAAPVLARVAL